MAKWSSAKKPYGTVFQPDPQYHFDGIMDSLRKRRRTCRMWMPLAEARRESTSITASKSLLFFGACRRMFFESAFTSILEIKKAEQCSVRVVKRW